MFVNFELWLFLIYIFTFPQQNTYVSYAIACNFCNLHSHDVTGNVAPIFSKMNKFVYFYSSHLLIDSGKKEGRSSPAFINQRSDTLIIWHGTIIKPCSHWREWLILMRIVYSHKGEYFNLKKENIRSAFPLSFSLFIKITFLSSFWFRMLSKMDEEDAFIILSYLFVTRSNKRRLTSTHFRKHWVKHIYKQRENMGAYNCLLQELRLKDRESHFRYYFVFSDLCFQNTL